MEDILNKTAKQFICINCGHPLRALYKKFSNSLKTVQCEKCRKVADKYIEFEPVIILVDAVLLSQQAFRHMLYNRNFKLHWKLSMVLLLLESFALWRKKRDDIVDPVHFDLVHEKGFYLCCLENIADYAIMATVLLLCSLLLLQRRFKLSVVIAKIRNDGLLILKAIIIANFSKFFLLPIMVWRANATEFGSDVHHWLVMGHHLFALIFIYAVVCHQRKRCAALIVLPAFLLKEYLKAQISTYMLANF